MERNGLVRTKEGRSFLLPFILITSLFFLWGFAHSILDVLNKHFQDTMEITRTRSALIQAVVYGGYFIMALPAGNIIRRFGYRAGVLTGLVLYGVGALLFIPGGRIGSFEFFLFSLFVIGCGLTCLETAANPYVTVLGDPEGSERRLNLAQSFNGLGWICGPLVGGFFLFAGGGDVSTPYAIIGCIVLAVALVFARMKLPEIGDSPAPRMKEESTDSRGLWKESTFTFGLVALFLYVAAQTGINSFFINYATETAGISAHEASVWLSFGGMGLFMAGRMGGKLADALGKGGKGADGMCRGSRGKYGCRDSAAGKGGMVRAAVLFPVRVDHVPHHLCTGTEKDGKQYQEGVVVPHHVDCGRGHRSGADGGHRGYQLHGGRILRSAGMLCCDCGVCV